MQQIINKGCVKIKELFPDLFKLRNAVSLKKNPLQKDGNSWGVGESTNDPLEGKFQGGGGQNLKNHPWWGYGYFLEPHIGFLYFGDIFNN